jgi:hypothetical protein
VIGIYGGYGGNSIKWIVLQKFKPPSWNVCNGVVAFNASLLGIDYW